MAETASQLRERVRRVPGMQRLLPALEGLEPAYLVGGAVRDLLRGTHAVDIDVGGKESLEAVGNFRSHPIVRRAIHDGRQLRLHSDHA